MKKTPRSLAVDILNRVEAERSFAEPLLTHLLDRGAPAGAEDRKLLTELVYGTLRLRNRLDWIIGTFYSGAVASMERGIRNILRVALYQAFCMDRIPHYAAVHEAVGLAKRLYPGRDRLVNALLRNALRQKGEIGYPDYASRPLEHIAVYHSHPLWLVSRWEARYGLEQVCALCEANNRTPPSALRVNTIKTDRETIVELLSKEGFRVRPSLIASDGIVIDAHPFPVRKHGLFTGGCLQFQDEASQLVSLLLNPQPGDRVLDLCSGAGIKATHLGAMMQNRGTIVAVDSDFRKMARGVELAKRLGVKIIERITADGKEDLGPLYHGQFDRILVDAPCTGLGTIRRKPEIKWFADPDDSGRCAALQGELLLRCSRYLKEGGTMVYATCTTEPEENEGVVEKALASDSSLVLCEPPALRDRSMIDAEGFFRTWPHRHGTDGFFGAVLKKQNY